MNDREKQLTDGALAGEYKTVLAVDSARQAQLWAVVMIDKFNGYHLEFVVKRGGVETRGHSLSAAIRKYEENTNE